MPAKAGIQAGRLRGRLVDSRFRGNDEFGTQLSSWGKASSPFDPSSGSGLRVSGSEKRRKYREGNRSC
jgi:hypothetical protein